LKRCADDVVNFVLSKSSRIWNKFGKDLGKNLENRFIVSPHRRG